LILKIMIENYVIRTTVT